MNYYKFFVFNLSWKRLLIVKNLDFEIQEEGEKYDGYRFKISYVFIKFNFKCYFIFDVVGVLFYLYCSRVYYWMLRLQLLFLECFQEKMVLLECKL